mgnify:CR=1 FL=1
MPDNNSKPQSKLAVWLGWTGGVLAAYIAVVTLVPGAVNATKDAFYSVFDEAQSLDGEYLKGLKVARAYGLSYDESASHFSTIIIKAGGIFSDNPWKKGIPEEYKNAITVRKAEDLPLAQKLAKELLVVIPTGKFPVSMINPDHDPYKDAAILITVW